MNEADSTPGIDNVTYEGRDLEVLADMPNYNSWIMSEFKTTPRGVAIEYGAGAGTISRRLRPTVEQLTLVEPSTNLVAILQRHFASDPQVTVHAAMLEDHIAAVKSDSVDSVVLVNVLEHIEDDAAALTSIFRVLKQDGYVFLFVPALSWLMSDLDRSIGHFRRYGKAGLVSTMEQSGFELVSCKFFDVLGVLPWLVVNTILRRKTFSTPMMNLYDRAVVPVGSRLEPLFGPPIGKNLIAVGRKR